jgi:uncharacterized membrane protein YhiD involved in acid resistance
MAMNSPSAIESVTRSRLLRAVVATAAIVAVLALVHVLAPHPTVIAMASATMRGDDIALCDSADQNDEQAQLQTEEDEQQAEINSEQQAEEQNEQAQQQALQDEQQAQETEQQAGQ